MRIALFGGAFDPPHIGHVLCACYALQVAELDTLWVLPSASHPYGKPMRPFGDRMAMCRLAFADLAAVELRDDELRNDSGRTVDLLAMVNVIPVPRRGYDDEHPAALPAISSTMVRERLADGLPAEHLVPRGVAAYIRSQGLYLTAG